jgi:uncharacterized protein
MNDIQQLLTILVDADATPRDALQTTDELAAQFGAKVVTISTINHQFDRPGHIMVDAHPQAVDMVIVSKLTRGEPYIVITQDYGLAALALGKGAYALSPKGLVYTDENIDRLLVERELHAKERRATSRSKGPSARSAQDKENFAQALLKMLQACSEQS